MKPRWFWTRVYVTRLDGSEETWFVETKANRTEFPSDYLIETTIMAYREKTKVEMDLRPTGLNQTIYRQWRFTNRLTKDEGAFHGRNWSFDRGLESHLGYFIRIQRDDGNDFGSISDAVWMWMEKCVDLALQQVSDRYNLHHLVSGTRLSDHPSKKGNWTEARYEIKDYSPKEPVITA